MIGRRPGGEVEELEVDPLDVLGRQVQPEVGQVAGQRAGKVVGRRGRHRRLLQPLVERRRQRHFPGLGGGGGKFEITLTSEFTEMSGRNSQESSQTQDSLNKQATHAAAATAAAATTAASQALTWMRLGLFIIECRLSII